MGRMVKTRMYEWQRHMAFLNGREKILDRLEKVCNIYTDRENRGFKWVGKFIGHKM